MNKQIYLIIITILLILFIQYPAKADLASFLETTANITLIMTTLTLIVQGGVLLAVTPAGMSAAIKCFRHIVLNNV